MPFGSCSVRSSKLFFLLFNLNVCDLTQSYWYGADNICAVCNDLLNVNVCVSGIFCSVFTLKILRENKKQPKNLTKRFVSVLSGIPKHQQPDSQKAIAKTKKTNSFAAFYTNRFV